ncbi:MAG: glutamate--tRNA ligase, partial [Dehalococcoidia bacterium]|nr:glutamate--tRNA ligase [Dehalococcoidia bacterium]
KVEGALDSILTSLKWLGLDFDEGPGIGGPYGPYFQSQRLDIYRSTAEKLIAGGYAYYCFCSPERLDSMRQEQAKLKQPPGYDRRCRNLGKEEVSRLKAEGITPVVRFKIPLEGQTVFNDIIRGDVVFENSTQDDFVLLKSDGFPTYHLANIVDDHLMEVSHVLRADEWLSSTPRHVLLYQAMGYEAPLFAHLPIILGPDRSKLSKRHGTTSLMEFKKQGYLSEAMVNFLALLGWSLDEKTEIMSRKDLVDNFSLERVGKTGAIFNLEKLTWMNGTYIRALRENELVSRAIPFLEETLPAEVKRPLSRELIKLIVPLVRERVRTLKEFADMSDFFFMEIPEYSTSLLLGKGIKNKETALMAVQRAHGGIEQLAKFDATSLEGLLRPLSEQIGIKTGDFFGLLRIAVTGRMVAPPLFQTMAVMGKDKCLKCLDSAIKKLVTMK